MNSTSKALESGIQGLDWLSDPAIAEPQNRWVDQEPACSEMILHAINCDCG